jgi:hypothetical protein
VAAVIRIDTVWLAVAPLDMRAGMDTVLARVVTVLGAHSRIMPISSPIVGRCVARTTLASWLHALELTKLEAQKALRRDKALPPNGLAMASVF